MPTSARHRIIFDTDPGIDDAMALVFAHLCPDIDLLGITTTFGNASIEQTTRNAVLLERTFGMSCPVHQGAGAPLVIAADEPPAFVHGHDGLGDAGLEGPAVTDPGDAVGFLIDTVRAHPGEVSIVAVGRMTNLALALERDPGFAGNVKQVVIMGGALGRDGHGGNVTPCAEANIIGDPHAADRVLGAPWPLTMVGLDVTMKTRMTPRMMDHLAARGGEAGAFVNRIAAHYRAFYASTLGSEAFPVHDFSALACLLAPELYVREQGALRVVTEGIAMGQTLFAPPVRDWPDEHWGGLPAQSVCVGVDADAVLQMYLAALTD